MESLGIEARIYQIFVFGFVESGHVSCLSAEVRIYLFISSIILVNPNFVFSKSIKFPPSNPNSVIQKGGLVIYSPSLNLLVCSAPLIIEQICQTKNSIPHCF